MADDSLNYCDSEEECFFGKPSDKELLKSALLGQNYASPAVARYIPRQTSANLPSRSTLTLPDVLQGSTNGSVRNNDSSAVDTENGKSVQSKHFPSVNSSFNESDEDIEIIDLDSQNNSVQIISDDDESFLKNENLARQSTSKSPAEYQNLYLINENKPSGVSELGNKSSSSYQLSEYVTSEEHREYENHNMLTTLENICSITTNTGEGGPCDMYESDKVQKIRCSLDKRIEAVSDEDNNVQEFLRDEAFEKIIHIEKSKCEENEMKMICDEKSDLGTQGPAVSAIETLIQASIQIEKESKAVLENEDTSTFHSHPFRNISESSNLDYSSLNAVSDSILNISHGSSISSPVLESSLRGLHGLQSKVVYEDISCDGDQAFGTGSESSSFPLRTNENEDLHMSVDEPNFVQGNLTTLANLSQPSLYESCSNSSHISRYYSANNNEHFVSQQPSSSFATYRETLEDSVMFEGANAVPINLGTDDEAKKETSFEIVAQNRQNSFASIDFEEKLKNTNEQAKPKKISKLPMYHGSSNILKPSKLNVKPEALKTTTFDWAKHFTKLDKTGSGEMRCETRIGMAKTNISLTSSVLKSQGVQNKSGKKTPSSKIPSHVMNKGKTPSERKQPGESSNSYPPRTIKSDMKTPTMTTPSETPKIIITLASSEKKVVSHGKINVMASKEKQKYRHIISPIHAYINASSVVLHKKAVDAAESPRVRTAGMNVSRIPTRTPIKTTKAVQRLHFESHHGQENVDPNYSRDTLPPRTFEPSSSVFIMDPELPRNFPKMGGTMQKLIDTPRPKIIKHQGRVKESPTAKGVLIPNMEGNTPNGKLGSEVAQGRISVRVVKSVEKTN